MTGRRTIWRAIAWLIAAMFALAASGLGGVLCFAVGAAAGVFLRRS